MFDCPVRLMLYGPCDALARANLEQRLKDDKLVKVTELKKTRRENEMQRKGMDLKSGRRTNGLNQDEVSMNELVQASQAVNFRGDADAIKTLAMSEDQLAEMPKAEQPAALKAQLLPYQLQGLSWLIAKESPQFPYQESNEAVQLWKRDNRGRYLNVASNFTVGTAPKLVSGGILADDMGLGKTLQMISLILTAGTGATLIVAPVSVMSNWEQQVQRHVHESHAPRVLIYHGAQRKLSSEELANKGIVITSYGTLMSEHKNNGALARARWQRVILDEGHTIRNARSKAAAAACALHAQSRWVLSGTPM